jgi:hypothetical protein
MLVFFGWPFGGGLFGLIVPFFFFFIAFRVLRHFLRGNDRSFRNSIGEQQRPRLPFDDFTDRSQYPEYTVADVSKPTDSYETAIFRLADEMKGRLTVSDIVIGTDLGLKEAERIMDRMVDGSHVTMEVTDSGRVVYEFPEIIARYERESDEGKADS